MKVKIPQSIIAGMDKILNTLTTIRRSSFFTAPIDISSYAKKNEGNPGKMGEKYPPQVK